VWTCCAAVLLLPSLLVAANRRVPEDYSTIEAAYATAQSGDTIVIQPNLYLEMPPAAFNNPSKLVLFRPASERVLITASNPPPNDAFVNRTLLSGTDFTITSENYAAAAALEPNERCTCRSISCNLALAGTVWFEWTAPTSGLAIVSAFGSDFHAVLDVFKGTAVPLSCLSNELIWNNTLNEIGFVAQKNKVYFLRVAGADSQRGQIVLSVTMSAPPTNDNFTAAYALTGAVMQVEGVSISATRENLEPNHNNAAASNSVWFSWIAPTGDAVGSRPATLSTAGSDFDTVLAVYQGADVGHLGLVVSNDDRDDMGSASAGESQVTFTPTPGGAYFIALDGSTRHTPLKRQQFGNYLVRLDYSVVDLSVQSVSRLSTNADRAINFQADVTVHDWGLAPTGPLRIRLAARQARDFAGIHRAPATSEINLGTFDIPMPTGLMSGESRSLTVSGVCPAPFLQFNGTNIAARQWGVFAVLEERLYTNWVTIDRAFLLYGLAQPFVAVTYGLSRPVSPALVPNEANQVVGVGVRLSTYLTDRSTSLFSLIALLDNDREGLISTATWSAPDWVMLADNGSLHVGDLSQTTNFTVTGRYNLGGVTRTVTDFIPIYKRPRLTLQPTATLNRFQYIIQGDFNAPFALEYTDDLRAADWQTNSVGTLTLFPSTNTLVGSNFNGRFYRLNLQPTP